MQVGGGGDEVDKHKEGTYQIMGPQVVAKPKMKKDAMTIMAVPVDSVAWGSSRFSEKWPVWKLRGLLLQCRGIPTDRGKDEEHHAHPHGADDQ